MSEQQPAVVHTAHNPFDAPKPKMKGLTTSIIVAIVVHGVVGIYLWKAKFEPHYRQYEDTKLDTTLIKPPPPPPP